jgi:hypothetical protein
MLPLKGFDLKAGKPRSYYRTMKHHIKIIISGLVLLGSTFGEATFPPKQDPTAYIRFVLKTIATPGLDPAIVAKQESFLVARFGLNDAELTSLRSMANSARALLQQNQTAIAAIVSGKNDLSDSDRASVAQQVLVFESAFNPLVTQLLQSVRPEVAIRMQATPQRRSK